MSNNAPLMSGVPELLLLKLLSAREMYGYELARAIRTTTKDAISVGESVLYPALHTLERRGWLKSKRKAVQGRTRVYYSLTPAGKRRLVTMTEEWHRIAGGVAATLMGAGHAQ
jgi:PadR family transcriptional regulator, regulatory protein PadR